MNAEEIIEAERWILEQAYETLGRCWDTLNRESDLGRDVNQSRNLIGKLLDGGGLSGLERFETRERR